MPRIREIRCANCALRLASGWGGMFYVATSLGERQICPHPGELEYVAQVLGFSKEELADLNAGQKWWWSSDRKARRARIKEAFDKRTGFLSDCFCEACGNMTGLDLNRDELKCPKCSASAIFSVKNMVGRTCLRCNNGVFEEFDTGIVA